MTEQEYSKTGYGYVMKDKEGQGNSSTGGYQSKLREGSDLRNISPRGDSGDIGNAGGFGTAIAHGGDTKLSQQKKDIEDKITAPGELAPESTKATSILSSATHLEDNVDSEREHMEARRAIGAISDSVLTGSPAQEYGAQGQFALDGMIDEARRLAAEKYQAMQHGDLEAAEAMDGDGSGRNRQ